MRLDSSWGASPLFAFLLIVGWGISRLIKWSSSGKAPGPTPRSSEHEKISSNAYQEIESLENFDWQTTEPLQFRPFKPRYHLTMALENTTISELVPMDKTYLDRICLRRQLVQDHTRTVIAANAVIKPAVDEFYFWMMGTYLPRRFPSMFRLISDNDKSEFVLENLVTKETIPLQAPSDAEEALRILAAHVDDDFLFLLPSANPSDKGKYKLEGYINCFPSGFDTRAKLNLKLADIHTPVPGYKAKLEKSMDRFFATVPVGKIVKRVNWGITTNTKLFTPTGNHFYEEDVVDEHAMEEIDINQTVVRCERQTLHRLPESKALLFAFKTYQYPIRQIKEEGGGEELAQAIDGLSTGTVPQMAFYKRGVLWGETVKAYLRS